MVELSGSNDHFQHGFPNVVFILPGLIVVGLSGKIFYCFTYFFIYSCLVLICIGNFNNILIHY